LKKLSALGSFHWNSPKKVDINVELLVYTQNFLG